MIKSLSMFGAAMLVATPAFAAETVYTAPTGLAGDQDWAGTLGLNFFVNAPVTITGIGVFDSGSDGLRSTLTATIYNVATGLALFTPVTFSSGTASSGSAYIFQSITPLYLTSGTYQVAAWGYSQDEQNYNYGFFHSGNGGPIAFDSVGGRLTALSSAFSYSAGGVATIADDGNTRYGAGSFIVSVPEPATWAMMIAGFGVAGGVMRRRAKTVRVAYA